MLKMVQAFLALAVCCVRVAYAAPNVLFIVVDDLAPAFEQYGNIAKTPNLGRLAAMGTQMQRAYVSIAVCAPSRTAFLTGLRPDTSQVWTIGPYFRNASRGQGMDVITLPQLFRQHGYNTTGSGKIWHPGTPSGGLSSSEGGGDQCPGESGINNCTKAGEIGSWTEPYWFCDQYTNDTVQSPAMQQWSCSQHGEAPDTHRVFSWPSCGGGCIQNQTCIDCFQKCGTWGVGGTWDACDCPDACYPEGVIASQAIAVLEDKAKNPESGPWLHALGFKRPHLTYRAPTKYFDMYNVDDIPLPLHRYPSLSAPPISYSHSCINDNHDGSEDSDNGLFRSMAAGIYDPSSPEANACKMLVVNRTTPNGPEPSYIEINTDDNAVRDLRRAYYATISLMDAQLGLVLDKLESTGLVQNTIITFIGDHGYQNGEKGEWCKSNNFDLATRIPMYVVVPPSMGSHWNRGVESSSIVESIDLMVTLADLADIPLPKQAFGGESMKSLLTSESLPSRQKTWAMSQWPRRPSCTTQHGCTDGHGNPYEKIPDQAIMGYKLRTDDWAYIVWFDFDWGDGADPTGAASKPVLSNITATELYDHRGDDGKYNATQTYEVENLANDKAYHALIYSAGGLHDQLLAAIKTGVKKPMLE